MSIDLTAIKDRLAAATPGPWAEHWPSSRTRHPYIIAVDHPVPEDPTFATTREWIAHMEWGNADTAFIAHAPEDIAALIAEVERLTSLAEAADRWATAISEPNGVDAAERALAAAVEAWRAGRMEDEKEVSQ